MDKHYYMYHVLVEVPFQASLEYLEFTHGGESPILRTYYNFNKRILRIEYACTTLRSVMAIRKRIQLDNYNFLQPYSSIAVHDKVLKEKFRPIFNF